VSEPTKPTLTDAGCNNLRYEAVIGHPPELPSDSEDICAPSDYRFARLAFAAGLALGAERQRARDAEIARKRCVQEENSRLVAERDGRQWVARCREAGSEVAADIAAAIEGEETHNRQMESQDDD
jgi:hypothetical protein